MLYAILAPLFLSWSAIFGTRSQQAAGSQVAFIGRTVLGFVFLALYAFLFGQGLRGAALPWFVMGGIIGFGLGDICLFAAYARLGTRLTLLLWQCLAAPLAGLIEWCWLGTLPKMPELLATGVILLGVGFVLTARSQAGVMHSRHKVAGVFFGVGAALGQALATVISRYAYEVNQAHGFSLDGMTAAFQRILGGMLVTLVVMALRRRKNLRLFSDEVHFFPAAAYMLGNAICGPLFGIGCIQAALLVIPSVIVMGLAATAPVVVIPFTWWLNKDRPSAVALLGSLISVGGVASLVYFRWKMR